MTQAIIFDLDGVIIDTAHYHYIAWKRLASEFNINLTPQQNELLKGVSRMRSLEIILELGNIHLEESEKERLAEKKNKWFVEYIESIRPEEIFPGVRELLQAIRQQGIKVALILGISHEFDAVVDGTMVTHSKPDPEIFLLAASKLNIKPANCVVFEDAEAGVEAALAAGMKCVGVGSVVAAGMKCVGVGSVDQLGKANKVIARTGDFNMKWLSEL